MNTDRLIRKTTTRAELYRAAREANDHDQMYRLAQAQTGAWNALFDLELFDLAREVNRIWTAVALSHEAA